MLWNAKNGQIAVGNTNMSYVSFGRGEKLLVILPGLSDGLATVKGKALLLAGTYRRFFDRYTIYMFSRKDEMPEGYSIKDMAGDQAEAMRVLGLKKVSVMGVSEGGMIAQYLAADDPEAIDCLVLAVSAPRANPMIRECVGKWIALAECGEHRQLIIDTAEKSYSEKYLKKYRRLYPILGSIGKPSGYDRFLINANAILSFDAACDLDRIVCPTLIIGGSDDKIVGIDASHELKKLIADSELYVYEGLGHAAYEEAKDFNERVFRFIETAHDRSRGDIHTTI